ncbi:MAG TPA: sensory rhodopsin transducer [Armatimonadota bacterium]|nr:sensory rhodopsin transducer [Armatimonadota bacterium]
MSSIGGKSREPGEGHGYRFWVVPDGYLASSPGVPPGPSGYFSHESVCILNDGDRPAGCKLHLYFENRDPVLGIPFEVGARRSLHLRLDQVKDHAGQLLPRDLPYSLTVESDSNIVVQHSRLDCTQENLALFTTMAFPAPDPRD